MHIKSKRTIYTLVNEAEENKLVHIEGTELVFNANVMTEQTQNDKRIRICISEKNCKETKSFKLHVKSLCKLSALSKRAIGPIGSQTVDYMGERAIIVPKRYGFERDCGAYAWQVLECVNRKCSLTQ